MCNCIDKVLIKVKEHHNEKLPKHRDVIDARFENSVFSLGSLETLVVLPIVLMEKNHKTDKARNRKTSMTMSYCPFCGEKYG